MKRIPEIYVLQTAGKEHQMRDYLVQKTAETDYIY